MTVESGMAPPDRSGGRREITSSYPAKLVYRGPLAALYDQERLRSPYRRFIWRREFEVIGRLIRRHVDPGSAILDSPTGTGRFLPWLQEFGLRVTAADISADMLGQARRRVPGLLERMLRCDCQFLPFADRSFDHVFSLRFLGHLPPPTRVRVLREFGRVARKGLIVGYPILNPATGLKFNAANLLRRMRNRGPRAWWPATERSLKEELREAGLRVVDREGVFEPLEQVSILILCPSGDPTPAPARESRRVGFLGIPLDRSERWHPVFREFSKLFPETTVVGGPWPGYIRGHEGTFRVKSLRGIRFVPLGRTQTGYARGFLWVSPMVLAELSRLRLQAILTVGFGLWTLYALVLKRIAGCCVIVIWQGVSPETGGTKGSLRLKLRHFMAKWIDGAITNTEEGARYLAEQVGMAPARITNAIFEVADLGALQPPAETRAADLSLQRPIFLYVGRLTRGKGVHVLLEACRLLIQRGQSHFSVVLVGTGSQEGEMRRLSSDLGLDGWVRWEGPVPNDQLGRWYDRGDVFVLPSLEDTWGVVVMEAMVFGKPVLCSRLAGVRRVVQHGVNGFLIDPTRAEDLADGMERFIRDPEMISAFGMRSRELADAYTPERAASVLAAAVTSALGQNL